MANGEALPSDVPKEERQCPCCGDEMPVIDTDIRERREFIPAKFLVHELHHLKRACGKCKESGQSVLILGSSMTHRFWSNHRKFTKTSFSLGKQGRFQKGLEAPPRGPFSITP